MLRSLQGYDEQNTMLLPPRAPGTLLPKQLLDHYEASTNKTTASMNASTSGSDEKMLPEQLANKSSSNIATGDTDVVVEATESKGTLNGLESWRLFSAS